MPNRQANNNVAAVRVKPLRKVIFYAGYARHETDDNRNRLMRCAYQAYGISADIEWPHFCRPDRRSRHPHFWQALVAICERGKRFSVLMPTNHDALAATLSAQRH